MSVRAKIERAIATRVRVRLVLLTGEILTGHPFALVAGDRVVLFSPGRSHGPRRMLWARAIASCEVIA